MSTRQQVHRQIAQVLEARFFHTVDTQPELVAHHYTEAGHLHQAIRYWQLAGERASTRAAHTEAIQHAQTGLDLLSGLPESEHGFSTWSILAKIHLGSAKATRDESAEAIALLTENIATWRALGLELNGPFQSASLAEAYRTSGQLDKALASVSEALHHSEQYGERWYDAECYRLRGAYTLAQSADQHGEAEADFIRALEVAQTQQAKALALRAAMNLARLWQQQGKTTEAHQRLSEIYNWFTEGFETKDLQQARSLLGELSRSDRFSWVFSSVHRSAFIIHNSSSSRTSRIFSLNLPGQMEENTPR